MSQCIAITKKNTRCKKTENKNGLCTQHLKQAGIEVKTKAELKAEIKAENIAKIDAKENKSEANDGEELERLETLKDQLVLMATITTNSDVLIAIVSNIELLDKKIKSILFKPIKIKKECCICLSEKENFIQLMCKHSFCTDCVFKTLKTTNDRCSLCKRCVCGKSHDNHD